MRNASKKLAAEEGRARPPELRNRLSTAFLCVLILSAVLCALFWNVVFEGYTLSTSTFMYGTTPQGPYGYRGSPIVRGYPVRDSGPSAWVEFPLTELARREMLSGHLPLWNPHTAAGMPLAADMVSAPLFPLKILFLLGTSAALWDFYLLLRILIAGIFTFLFLRSIGSSKIASIGAACLFMFCGQTIYYINMPLLNSELCLPGMLWAGEKLVQTRSRGYALVLGLFVASSNLGGLPETTFFVLLFAGAYVAFRLVCLAREDPSASLRAFALGIGGSVIGFLLAAPVLLPFVEFLRIAYHGHTRNMARISLSPAHLITFFVPFFYGKLGYTWLKKLYLPAPYLGVVAPVLAAVGVASPGKNRGRALFFACCAIIYLLRAYDVPGTGWAEYIPVFNKAIFPQFAGSLLHFSVAALGGLGLDAIVKEKRFGQVVFLAIVVSIGGLIAGYYWNTFETLSSPLVGKILDPRWLDTNLKHYVDFHVMVAVVFLTLATLLVFAGRYAPIRPKVTAILLIGLYLIEARVYLGQLERTRRYEAFVKPPFVEFLQSDREPFRIVSTDEILFPNTSAAFGIDDIRVLQALYYNRYVRFAKAFLTPKMAFEFSKIEPAFLADPATNLCNIKYVLTTRRIDNLLPPYFRLVYAAEIGVYQNMHALPRAYVAGGVQFVDNGEEAMDYLQSNRESAGRGAVVVVEDPAAPQRYVEMNQQGSKVEIVSYEPHRVRIRATLADDGVVTLLDSNYPGWKATVDGTDTRIMHANYLFRAVRVPAGTHEIVFVYKPLSVRLGLILFGIGLFLGVCVLVYPLRPGRARSKTGAA